jgi:aspartate oxidase
VQLGVYLYGGRNAMVTRSSLYNQGIEFIEFHPTVIYGVGCLNGEAARAEGDHLLNGDNQLFTDELEPRDIVARAIANEI